MTWQEKLPQPARSQRASCAGPRQSTDGELVAFDAFGRVWLQALAAGKPAGQPRRLTRRRARRCRAREYGRPSRRTAVDRLRHLERPDGGHVWKAPLRRRRAASSLTRRPGHYANPAWSRRATGLAVMRGSGLEFRGRQPEEESFFEIHWLDAGGGDTHYVTTVTPPDRRSCSIRRRSGTRTAHVCYFREAIEPKKPTDDPKNDLVSVRLDGTDKKRASSACRCVAELVPSPDERWVAFTSRDNVYVAALPAGPDQGAGRRPRSKEGRCRSGASRDDAGRTSAGPTAARRSPGRWARPSTGCR